MTSMEECAEILEKFKRTVIVVGVRYKIDWEDLYQDVFIKLSKCRHRYQPIDIQRMMSRVITCEAIDKIRKIRKVEIVSLESIEVECEIQEYKKYMQVFEQIEQIPNDLLRKAGELFVAEFNNRETAKILKLSHVRVAALRKEFIEYCKNDEKIMELINNP